ncbi:hypothetical protein PL321_02415 [Caloramator sp. mosi_1]|uniref:hypothetical protein n=1 Tax=Caloramator sp. mosi_1 TaxID=3023090 RepID=UPI002361481C|nr:hypothetical protein [Caloramator sp. mosi_1]WDC84591.1 hypothetical protein PL321_02415 [Caloramator sp. mosi_1]
MNLSNSNFNKTFKTTSAGWRGKKVLQRNMVIAMGNSKNKEYLNILKGLNQNEYLQQYIKNAIKKLEVEK